MYKNATLTYHLPVVLSISALSPPRFSSYRNKHFSNQNAHNSSAVLSASKKENADSSQD
ncbi:hypothetical protein JCM19297_995 [Nonlabens ulvanivorans]|nr:hypothetical protein JCM19297_995 [Nonlabens ulvanivorans]